MKADPRSWSKPLTCGEPLLTRDQTTVFTGLEIEREPLLAGNEDKFLPEELQYFARCSPLTKRASASARIAARRALSHLGIPKAALARKVGLPPEWPMGVVGSLSHCEDLAVAAVGRTRDFLAIGIDIEPCLPLPNDLIEAVLTRAELSSINGNQLLARACFCAKEAAYKAAYSIDRIFQEALELSIDFQHGLVATAYGRTVRVAASRDTHIITVAAVPRRAP